jgi:sigma-B regulation protein RsbU (phosphoserine phosphatase)
LERQLHYQDCEPQEVPFWVMRILVAEDDPLTLGLLTELVKKWDYETISVNTGDLAWEKMQLDDNPLILLADWQIPGAHGDELCKRARAQLTAKPLHIILTTATQLTVESKVRALAAGADDYLLKPYDPRELQARLHVGERALVLQMELRKRVVELEGALAEVEQLKGLLCICSDCKRIRDEQERWQTIEKYLAARMDVSFTHGLCPKCTESKMKELARTT